jgi:repressor LexA
VSSARREQIVKFIQSYVEANGYAPSRREIADAIDSDVTSIQWHIDILVREGILRRAPGVSRGISLTGASMKHREEHA